MFLKVCVLLFLLNFSQSIDLIYYVDEGRSPGIYVGNIGTDLKSVDSTLSNEQSLITFSQLQKEESFQLFNVTKIGKLYTAQLLNAESLCTYNTECFKVLDVAVKKRESVIKIIEIKVIVVDVNDHKPEFPVKLINIQFSEDDRRGLRRIIPNAIDKDIGILNSQITYQLKTNMNEPFALSISNRVDGKSIIEIILKDKLDREEKDQYNVQVIAKDGGSPAKQSILDVQIAVIDENDNPPIFSQDVYNVSIRNTDKKDIPIIVLNTTDLDSGKNSQTSYLFSSKTSIQVKTHFKLNEKTGEIFLDKSFSLKKRQSYKLYIESIDGGNPPLTSATLVLVNIINQQNNAPSINMNFFSKSTGNTVTISEGIRIGTFIAYVKITDNDSGQNGEVTCHIQHDKFLLQAIAKKKYKLVIKKEIDRETISQLDFTIICIDEGSPPLTMKRVFSIEITDVNDVKPQFTKNTFKFLTYENEEIHFPIGFINATDPDLGPGGQLTYSLLDYSKDIFPFEISNFGFISTTQSLDYEQQNIYEFTVLVKDNGTPSLNNTANVIVEVVDKNDNTPYFTFPSVNPFSIDVHYHPQSNNDITVLRASDRDSYVNAFIRYEILNGNEKQLFTVNPYTGVLSFSHRVDQNDAGPYDLQLVIKDSGTPVLSATITLSLSLTVSNKTSTTLTAIHKKPDHSININLFIIIIVAAVIVSLVLVISITLCIVRKNDQWNRQYVSVINTPKKTLDTNKHLEYFCKQIPPQSDIPVTICVMNKDRRRSLPGYQSAHNWSESGTHYHTLKDSKPKISVQKATETSDLKKDKETVFTSPYCYSDLSTISYADSGRGYSEGYATHYEELPDNYTKRPEQLKDTEKKPLPEILSNPMDTNNTAISSYNSDIDQNTRNTEDIILKSLQVDSTDDNIPSQPRNLPMKNSFTSPTKPLPAIPKTS